MKDLLETKYKNVYEYYKALKPTNKTLVCIAGVSEGAYRWYKSLPILRQEFNIVLFNNPAIDCAPSKLSFTVDDLAAEFQEILDLLEVDSFYLMGHSMGGFVSQRIYLNNPHKVNKLVLIGTSYGSIQFEKDIKMLMDMKNTFKQGVNNLVNQEKLVKMQDFSFTKEFQNSNPEIIEEYLYDKQVKHKLSKRDLVSHFVCGGRFSSLGETHKITVPTLVIHGTKDRMVSVESGERLADNIPNAKFWPIENAGHTPFTENVNLMTNIIEFFVNNNTDFARSPEHKYKITDKMLEQDKYFREHSRSTAYRNFLKELFLLDDIKESIKNIYKNFNFN